MGPVAAALKSAGYVSPAERLEAVRIQEHRAHPDNFAAAKAAIGARIRADAELIYELFRTAWDARLSEFARAGAAEAERTRDVGHGPYGTHDVDAAPRVPPVPAGGGHWLCDTLHCHAAAAPVRPARIPLGAVAVLRALDRERIELADGTAKTLAAATAAEVRAYARRIGFRASWLERLAANLADDAVIGEWRGDDDLFSAQKEARESAR